MIPSLGTSVRQDWFLQNGQIAADRLFLVAPKPVDAAYRGESRVNLSLN